MTACACDYDSPASVYRKSERTAKKQHRCSECTGRILPGERYEYVFAVWDGDPGQVRTCWRCVALRDFVVAHIPCSCWQHHNLLDDMRAEVEHYGHLAPGLTMGYLRRYVAIQHANGWRPAKGLIRRTAFAHRGAQG